MAGKCKYCFLFSISDFLAEIADEITKLIRTIRSLHYRCCKMAFIMALDFSISSGEGTVSCQLER